MALSNVQELIERSIYEALRLVLVEEGYLPDITNTARFPNTPAGEANWMADLQSIRASKKFAIELFNHSSSQDKGMKATPRIAIIPRRVIPGDIGVPFPILPEAVDPNNPTNFEKYINPLQSNHLQIDIHLVSSTAAQDRILNAVRAKALGPRNFIQFINSTQRFFIEEYSYYDLPDSMEGIEEKVHSYEVRDVYLFEGTPIDTVVPIIEINYPIFNVTEFPEPGP